MSAATKKNFATLNREYRSATPVAHTFSAAHAYDKLLTLSVLAIGAGVFGYLALNDAETIVCVIVAFVMSLVATRRIRWAKFLAPAYAVIEGLALGAISSVYSNFKDGIVPEAVVLTAGIFFGCLVIYRTGLVRVTPKWVSFVTVGCVALIALFALSILGVAIPGVSSFGAWGVIVGLITLAVGVASLFVDFDYVRQSEMLGVTAEAEWAAALMMLISVVLVYLSILRILASTSGGRGSSGRA
jgi:uncharacterized YccA/Bax inhibitor family protein